MFNPSDFGITTEISVENLLNARAQYEKLVASLKGETTKVEAPKLENEDDQNEADEFITGIRSALFATLDANPILSLVLVDSLQAIVKDVKEFKAWFVSSSARNGVEVPTTDGGKETADKLKEFIGSLFNASQAFKLELPEEFKVKQNKAGETVPDLSRLPYEKGTATKKVGGYTLRYRWMPTAEIEEIETAYGAPLTHELANAFYDAIEIPAGTFTDEIAMKYVSTPTYRIGRTEVFDALPHRENVTPTGQTRRHLDMPKDGSSVFVQFETGVLEAWLPTDAPVEVEEAEEDSTEEEESEQE